MGRPSIVDRMQPGEMDRAISRLLVSIVDIEAQINPFLFTLGSHFNINWGYISRSGFVDKSHLMRQIEKYADLYTSRVSNFLRYTPFHYFRSSQLSLAHNPKFSPAPDRWQQQVAGGGGALRGNACEGKYYKRGSEEDEGESSPIPKPPPMPTTPSGAPLQGRGGDTIAAVVEKIAGMTAGQGVRSPRAARAGAPGGGALTGHGGGGKEFGHYIGLSGVPLLDNEGLSEPDGVMDLGWEYASHEVSDVGVELEHAHVVQGHPEHPNE